MIRIEIGSATVELRNVDVRKLPADRRQYRADDLLEAVTAALRAVDPNGRYLVERVP